MLALNHLHKTDIGALRETFVAFQNRTKRFYRSGIDIIDLNHAMWISHRHHAA